jgi:hypothetical protein
VIVRTGGQPGYAFDETLTAPVELRLVGEAGELGRVRVPPPRGVFVELAFELPAQHVASLALRAEADGMYRVFHWFVLQPADQ